MLKLLKNLKDNWITVLAIIILLCLQAWTDLTLPDYTAKIVNTGIQAGGIENIAPMVISKTTMNKILIFTDKDNEILGKYTLISKINLSESEYLKLKKEYPLIEKEELYKLNKINKQEKEELDTLITKPLMAVYFLEKEEYSSAIKEDMLKNIPEEQRAIMKQMSLIDIISSMPKDSLSQMVEQINKGIDEKLGIMINQAAIQATKNEYIAIGVNLDKIQNGYILKTGAQMIGIALISMTCAVTIMLFSARTAASLGRTLREKVFKKVLKFTRKEFNEFSTASLITRNTNDIQQIQLLIGMLFRVVIYAPIMGVGGFLKVLTNSNNTMSWVIGVAIGSIILVISVLFIVAMPVFKKLQDLIDKLNLVSREILTGLPVIRAFNTEKREEKRFEKANRDLMDANIFVNRAMSIMFPALIFIMDSVMLLIIWVGGHKVNEGIMQVGDMMAFIQYTMQIVISFLFISMLSIILPRAAVSAKRINEVLETEPSIKDTDSPKDFLEEKKGYVEFKNVSFRYPDADTEILEDITFTAEPGKTTAIIGSTGSGKSTVVNLIPRFYDVTNGELLVDGVNVKDVKQKELRKRIGFVPQKGVLFSGTIESNIKYGNSKISDEQMKKVASIAQATDFIEGKENGFSSEIAQGGNNVSGGQKQRLSIARALAIDPEIIVFDDSFSALDFKTDSKLREELSKQTKGKTVIIVAQRISTILNADQIIVLDEGKIVGIGKHKELLQNCKEYQEIASSQLSQEELEGGVN